MFSPSSSVSRMSPLPDFSWADPREVWGLMVAKDELYYRDPSLLHRHPAIQSRMRSILFDWLSEVCEVYKLHRETFYLAIDFVDRYLTNQTDLPKQQLQLIGITCLFIASKIEEIYPPKLSEFAYVTDGACVEEEIIINELVILKSLNWGLTPITANSWLSTYVQLYASFEKENVAKTKPESGDTFMVPDYPSQFFAQIGHLLDLSMLDIGSLQFRYSFIAAAAIFHFTNEEAVYQCTGLKLPDIKDCVLWMMPFALAISEEGFDHPKLQKSEDATASLHSIQSHTADLPLLEKAHLKQSQVLNCQDDESGVGSEISSSSPGRRLNILTPPRSSNKQITSESKRSEGKPFRRAESNKRRREPLWASEGSNNSKALRTKSPSSS
ncbi:G1/S-specific cyclin-E [Halotydeus destructor]|nr:G1/S-specific cyclin-E [Halotydeus destructor]